jgi:hypothetical protein
MRGSALYILIVILALLAGVLLHRFWIAPANAKKQQPIDVSLCELLREPERYDWKLVRLKAILYSDVGGPFIYDWSCGTNHPYPLVDLRAFDDLPPELADWVKNIGSLDAKGEGLEAQVFIEGVFDKSYYIRNYDCPACHRFRIIPKRIEQLTPLSKRT